MKDIREAILLLISRHEQIEGEAIYRIGMPILISR